jgi:hypothetical protein
LVSGLPPKIPKIVTVDLSTVARDWPCLLHHFLCLQKATVPSLVCARVSTCGVSTAGQLTALRASAPLRSDKAHEAFYLSTGLCRRKATKNWDLLTLVKTLHFCTCPRSEKCVLASGT